MPVAILLTQRHPGTDSTTFPRPMSPLGIGPAFMITATSLYHLESSYPSIGFRLLPA